MVLKTQALLGDTVLQEWLKLPACAQCWDHEDMGGHGRSCFKHKLCLAVYRMAAMLGPCMGVFGGQRTWLFIVCLCPLGLMWAPAVPFLWLTWRHSPLGSHFGEIVFDKRLNGIKRKLSQEYWRRDFLVLKLSRSCPPPNEHTNDGFSVILFWKA